MSLAQQLQQIAAQLTPKIDCALNNEVATAIKNEEAKIIDAVVYGVYNPTEYDRRRSSGGLSDTHNMIHSAGGGKLKVKNVTPPNPAGNGTVTTGKDLPSVVEHGYSGAGSYDFPKPGAAYMEPRPFTKETVQNLKENKKHIKALKSGLQRQGIKTN